MSFIETATGNAPTMMLHCLFGCLRRLFLQNKEFFSYVKFALQYENFHFLTLNKLVLRKPSC